MAAWSKAVAALVPPPRATDEMPGQVVVVDGEAADQLVHVLAGLVLGRLQPP
jgi:glucose-6-phosphate dehydrogenase assembly protein OpcA